MKIFVHSNIRISSRIFLSVNSAVTVLRNALLGLLVWFVSFPLSAQQFDRGQEPPMLAPAESANAFTVPDDLEIDLVLSEPDVAQPLQLTFDERGRLWVAEYRQ